PRSFSSPSARWQPGRRRSPSRRSTREPASAKLLARLRLLTVFPSLAPALVTRISLGGAPGAEKRIAVRRERNASAAGDRGSRRTTSSPPNPFDAPVVPGPLLPGLF